MNCRFCEAPRGFCEAFARLRELREAAQHSGGVLRGFREASRAPRGFCEAFARLREASASLREPPRGFCETPRGYHESQYACLWPQLSNVFVVCCLASRPPRLLRLLRGSARLLRGFCEPPRASASICEASASLREPPRASARLREVLRGLCARLREASARLCGLCARETRFCEAPRGSASSARVL